MRLLVTALLFASACDCGFKSVDDCELGRCDAGGVGGGSTGGGSAGGTSSGGGSGGSGGGSTSTDGGCVSCVSVDVAWGWNGGFVAYVDDMAVTTCRQYTRERTRHFPADAGVQRCVTDLYACPVTTVSSLERLLAEPVVVESLAAHRLFGVDSRPVDGSVFRISARGGFLEIGSCQTGECRPTAVRELQELLEAIDAEQLTHAPCQGVFP